MTKRSSDLEMRVKELEERLSNLDREFVNFRDREPDTSIDDWIDGIDRRVISLLLTHLEMRVPGFSVVHLRETIERLEASISVPEGSNAAASNTVDEFIRFRIKQAIGELIPESLYEGENALEYSRALPAMQTNDWLSVVQQKPEPPRE